MQHKIPKSRPWWLSAPLFIYIGATAFILGCGMVMYAPDIAARWPL